MASALQKLAQTKAPTLKKLTQTKNVQEEKKPSVLSSIFYAPSRFAESALNRLTMNKLPSLLPKPEPAQNIVEKAADVAGAVVGEVLPFAASYGTVGKAITSIPKIAKAGKLAQLAAKGAAASGAVGGVQAAVEGEDAKGIAKRALLYGTLGAAGDAALEGLLAPAVGRAISKYKQLKAAPKVTGETVASAEAINAEAIETMNRDVAKDIGVEWDLLNEKQRNIIGNLVKRNIEQTKPTKVSGALPPASDFVAGTTAKTERYKPKQPLVRPQKQAPATPIEERGFEEVSSRKVKAYQYEHPEVKSFIQDEAKRLQGELADTVKGQRFITGNQFEDTFVTGARKLTSEAIQRIQDVTRATYKEIDDALLRIIKDEGAENVALAKKIELIIDDNLSKGAKTIEGINVPPNEGYLATKEFINYKPSFPIKKPTLKEVPFAQKKVFTPTDAEIAAKTGKPISPLEAISEATTSAKASPELSGTESASAKSFNAKISRDPRKRGTAKEFMANLQTQFVEDVAPLYKVEKAVRGKIASAEDSLYKQARLFKGSPTKAYEIVRSRLRPIMEGVEGNGFNYKDLGDYALAVHAKDVNAKGITSGFTDAEINAVIKKFGTPEMETSRKQLVQVSTDILTDLADAGVISGDSVKIIRDKWPNYMPLFRYFDDDKVEFAQGMSQSLANVTSPIKKLEGSERAVIDPIESMVKNIFQSTNAADRNRVALQLARLADEDVSGQFIRKMKPGEEVGRKNAVYARINGEKVYYEVQPEVYRAVLQLDKQTTDFTLSFLQRPAALLRAGATLTPEFSLRNPLRDVFQAYVTSKSGFNPVRDVPASLFEIVLGKDKKLYRQFLMDNAGYGNIVSMDRDIHREALKRVLKQPPGDKFVNFITGKQLIGWLRTIADVSETATKLGEYRAALRSGVSRPEAAYRARDVMDFARAGTSTRNINKIVAFMNANIQGKSKILRAIREDPTGVTVRAVTGVTLPTVGIFMAQRYMSNDVQKQTIDEAPAWLRDTFWLLPVPGTNLVARLPKPFDLAPVFANLPERTLDYIANQDPQAFDKFAEETFSTLSIPMMITGMVPFIEGMANISFFRQAPIIPRREEGIEFVDQGDINTTETAKLIAKGVYGVTGGEGLLRNFGSPRVIDHVIQGLTAGLGRYATSAIDVVLEEAGVADKPERPAKKISEKPLAKAFLVRENMPTKYLDDLYEARDRLRREKGSAKAKNKTFDGAADLAYIERVTRRIGNISQSIRQIENDPNMSAKEKREQIDELNDLRNELARDAAANLSRGKKMGVK